MGTRCWSRRRGVSVFLLVAVAGCAESTTAPPSYSLIFREGDTYFLRQPERPGAVMDALFQGSVVKDDAGCLRLQPPASSTVVWPFGFTLDVRSDGEWILDATGDEVGKVGGGFRFGGGEVPFLHEGLGFSEPDITEIQTRCPGRFWIVGRVLPL